MLKGIEALTALLSFSAEQQVGSYRHLQITRHRWMDTVSVALKSSSYDTRMSDRTMNVIHISYEQRNICQ
jgi:hypothetical protein